MFITTSALFAALQSKQGSARSPEQFQSAHVFYGTLAFSAHRLLLMMCNQSDKAVGGTLNETRVVTTYKRQLYQSSKDVLTSLSLCTLMYLCSLKEVD